MMGKNEDHEGKPLAHAQQPAGARAYRLKSGDELEMKMMKWYAWTKAIFAAFGGFLFGYDAG